MELIDNYSSYIHTKCICCFTTKGYFAIMTTSHTASGWLSLKRVRLSHGRSWVWVLVGSYSKDHHKNGTNCLPAWGHALKRSPGINRKSRVLYPGPGFLFSATYMAFAAEKALQWINQSNNQDLQIMETKVYMTRK